MRLRTFMLIVTCLFAGCAQLPPETATAFNLYRQGANQRLDTATRTASSLYSQREKASELVERLRVDWATIDRSKPLTDAANTEQAGRINNRLEVLAALTKPMAEHANTINRLPGDRAQLEVVATGISNVLATVIDKQSGIQSMANAAVDISQRLLSDDASSKEATE